MFMLKKKRNPKSTRIINEQEEEDPSETRCANSFTTFFFYNSVFFRTKIEEMRDLQKLRLKPNGINVVGLALGKKFKVEEEVTANGLFNTKSGGMVNMQSVKTSNVKIVDDAYDTGIGTQFSAETNIRDQDEEMMKYIERQLNKQKGENKSHHESDTGTSKKYFTPEEAALYALPAYLRQTSSQKSEEMLSNQMLNGIPEVDLGIEAKIKNIEATEEAKQKLIQDQRKKKDGPSFVPVNIAANFTTHSDRCKPLFLQMLYYLLL